MPRLLAWILFIACACRAPAQVDQRPNILFLFADDLRRDAVAAFGQRPGAHTPNLDALAARGAMLTQVSCMGAMQGAVCVPSRAMVMSGRLLTHVREDLRDTPTLPEVLRARGYATFMAGKWHNGEAALRRAFPDARSVFRGGMCDHFHVPLCDVTAGEVENVRAGDCHSSELFADAAIAFLRDRAAAPADEPFFAYVAFTAPHDPRDPPPGALQQVLAGPRPPLPANFRGQHGLDLGPQTMTVRDENLLGWPRDPALVQRQLCEYYALVRDLDAQIGRVLQALADGGLADRTLVVFAADHGLALGSHGLLGKQSLYEHSMGAPVILAGPGVPAGVRRPGLAYLLDLMPTMAHAAGAPLPDGIDGVDLGPLVRGEGAGREALLTLYCDAQRALRLGDDKLIRLPQIDRTLWFDLATDPDELHDLAGDPARAAARLVLEEAAARRAAARRRCPAVDRRGGEARRARSHGQALAARPVAAGVDPRRLLRRARP
ncbi:MAG: sulfatase-like hydrolase/transferase [Planctomycetota bacterium]